MTTLIIRDILYKCC